MDLLRSVGYLFLAACIASAILGVLLVAGFLATILGPLLLVLLIVGVAYLAMTDAEDDKDVSNP